MLIYTISDCRGCYVSSMCSTSSESLWMRSCGWRTGQNWVKDSVNLQSQLCDITAINQYVCLPGYRRWSTHAHTNNELMYICNTFSFKGISLPSFMLCNFFSAVEELSKWGALYQFYNRPSDLQAEFSYIPSVLFYRRWLTILIHKPRYRISEA